MLLSSIPSSSVRNFRYAGSNIIRKPRWQHARSESTPIPLAVISDDSVPTEYNVSAITDKGVLDESLQTASLPISASKSQMDQKPRPPLCLSAKPIEEKLVIVMVGLPARGKSYLAKKLNRYLNWLQYPTKIFNVGEKRRKVATLQQNSQHSASFFHPHNEAASKLREDLAMAVLDDLLVYLEGGGCIGIFDATNTTVERRDMVVQRVREANSSLQVLFVESQCFNQHVLEFNMMLKLSGPDYKNNESAEALADFSRRVSMYEMKYAPIGQLDESKGYSYCQVIDVGRKTIMHNINDCLSTQAVTYLQHFHLYPRQIWLTRHGESEDDIAGRLGGDSSLSKRGLDFAQALPTFISQYRRASSAKASASPWMDKLDSLATTIKVWTSISQKCVQTAQFFKECEREKLKALDELSAGSLEGLTREDIRYQHADWFEARETNRFLCRYPGTAGEGYCDLSHRLRNIILEIERMRNHTLVISGLAVTRVLIAYFLGLMQSEIPSLEVPLGRLYVFEPQPYGIRKAEFDFDCEMKQFVELRQLSLVKHRERLGG